MLPADILLGALANLIETGALMLKIFFFFFCGIDFFFFFVFSFLFCFFFFVSYSPTPLPPVGLAKIIGCETQAPFFS